MIKWGRLTILIAAVIVIFTVIGTTGTYLARQIPLGLDLQGGIDVLYQVGNNGQHVTAGDVTATVAALSNRVNDLGVTSPSIDVENGTRVRVQLAGGFNQHYALAFLSKPSNLQFISPKGQVLFTGKDIDSNAAYAPDSTTGAPAVNVTFRDAARLQAVTQKYLGQKIAIWFNGKMLMDPVIQQAIPNGQVQISPFPSIQAADEFAKLLNAGALPMPLHVLSSISVGPTLGRTALQSTLRAGAFAVIVIFLFMLALYRLAGLIAVISLCAYSYVILFVFAEFPVTLTLTGLAALVLGIGMAVDANIITYERVKDELRHGKSLQSAVIAGQRKALRTILDSNVTTLIAGIVMYAYGTGDVRGFAVALIASIIVSLLTAVFLSRSLLMLLTRSNLTRSQWLYGYRKGKAVTAQ